MRIRSKVLEILILGLGALLIAYGIYLLVLGPILTIVAPSSNESPALVHSPNIAGAIPLVAGALVMYGERRRRRIAWVGTGLAVAFAVLFVFGVGGLTLPIALALVIALGANSLNVSRRPHQA